MKPSARSFMETVTQLYIEGDVYTALVFSEGIYSNKQISSVVGQLDMVLKPGFLLQRKAASLKLNSTYLPWFSAATLSCSIRLYREALSQGSAARICRKALLRGFATRLCRNDLKF